MPTGVSPARMFLARQSMDPLEPLAIGSSAPPRHHVQQGHACATSSPLHARSLLRRIAPIGRRGLLRSIELRINLWWVSDCIRRSALKLPPHKTKFYLQDRRIGMQAPRPRTFQDAGEFIVFFKLVQHISVMSKCMSYLTHRREM